MVGFLPLGVPPVVAYIDPGTGSLVIQVLIASFLGGLFLLKVYWKKVKKWFKKGRNGK